jgi:hypothetical protein
MNYQKVETLITDGKWESVGPMELAAFRVIEMLRGVNVEYRSIWEGMSSRQQSRLFEDLRNTIEKALVEPPNEAGKG